MSPDLEPQPGDDAIETPPEPVEARAPLPWIPTRRWLIEPAGPRPWSIEERQLSDGPSLFFVNDDGFVRVREYPANWLDLPEADLAALLQHPRSDTKPE